MAAAVAGPGTRVGDVTEELLSAAEPSASATVAVYRAASSGPPAWSAVCKVLKRGRQGHPRWQSSTDPGHWYWWRREELAYTSGLTGRLAGGLRAPRLLARFDRGNDSVALWIEDITVPRATEWTVERYGVGARHLGRAQAALMRELPAVPWLASGFLAGYLERQAVDFEAEPAETPLMVTTRRLFGDRERLLAAVGEQPLTMCHNDFHALNLFGDEGGESIAVDWAFVGTDPLPADAGPFATDAVLDYGAPVARLGELHEVVEDEFVAGLRDEGWRGDDVRLRMAMRVVAALKFAWIAPVVTRVDDARRARWEAHYGRPGDEVHADWTAVAEWLAEIGPDAARRLA